MITLRTRKTGRRQQIPIAAALLEHIKSLPKGAAESAPIHHDACHIVENEGKAGSLSRKFGELLAKVGLRKKQAHRKKRSDEKNSRVPQLSFHSLRHTATTWLHEAGVPSAVAQELIGHDSEAMHEIYVNVGEKALVEAVKSMPNLE